MFAPEYVINNMKLWIHAALNSVGVVVGSVVGGVVGGDGGIMACGIFS